MKSEGVQLCGSPPCAEVGPFRYCPVRGCGWMEGHSGTTPPTDMAKVNSGDAEDCEMCSLIEGEPCAFHQGVSAGVAWMTEMMKGWIGPICDFCGRVIRPSADAVEVCPECHTAVSCNEAFPCNTCVEDGLTHG